MKTKWWNSLRTKIIAWSFVPTVIILSAVAWFTFYSYQKVIGDLALKQAGEIVQNKVDRANQAINNLLNGALRPIALGIDTKYELPLEVRAQNILDGAPNLEVFDGGIYFVDQHGIVFITRPEQPGLIGQDWSDTPQFRYVRDHPPGSAPVTEIMDVGTGEAGIVCAIWPMHDPQVDGPVLRARTGVLTETPSLDERLTAWDNLSIYADLYAIPRADVRHRVDDLLTEFDLAGCAHEKVGGYSKGMKQRLALAHALLHKPELIFLDEATSGLDPVSAHHFIAIWTIDLLASLLSFQSVSSVCKS